MSKRQKGKRNHLGHPSPAVIISPSFTDFRRARTWSTVYPWRVFEQLLPWLCLRIKAEVHYKKKNTTKQTKKKPPKTFTAMQTSCTSILNVLQVRDRCHSLEGENILKPSLQTAVADPMRNFLNHWVRIARAKMNRIPLPLCNPFEGHYLHIWHVGQPTSFSHFITAVLTAL